MEFYGVIYYTYIKKMLLTNITTSNWLKTLISTKLYVCMWITFNKKKFYK